MLEKTKKFIKEHRGQVVLGGLSGLGVVYLALSMSEKLEEAKQDFEAKKLLIEKRELEDRKVLEDFGAEYRPGYSVPFATKEVAQRFMEERGQTYQIDILDKDTSVIWISE